MQWNTDLLEKYIAPSISSFTTVQIPDLSSTYPEAEHWLSNHFLNNIFRGSFKDQARQIALSFLRRVHHALRAYHQARDATVTYLASNQPDNPGIQNYYDAIYEWESFVLNTAMAIDLFKWLNDGLGAFQKNDGSAADRIYRIANQIKHVASCVESGQCTQNENIPLWLTNTHINSYGVLVSYYEASEILKDLVDFADSLQDPRSFIEKLDTANTT